MTKNNNNNNKHTSGRSTGKLFHRRRCSWVFQEISLQPIVDKENNRALWANLSIRSQEKEIQEKAYNEKKIKNRKTKMKSKKQQTNKRTCQLAAASTPFMIPV
jgi:hypothetical protein